MKILEFDIHILKLEQYSEHDLERFFTFKTGKEKINLILYSNLKKH